MANHNPHNVKPPAQVGESFVALTRGMFVVAIFETGQVEVWKRKVKPKTKTVRRPTAQRDDRQLTLF